MALPQNLKDAIETELSLGGSKNLIDATDDLSKRYRDQSRFKKSSPPQHLMTSAAHRNAYLASRMPATFAAVRRALLEMQHCMPDAAFRSLLDLGTGPGTALWAVADLFPSLLKATLVEQDTALIEIGRRLAKFSDCLAVRNAQWNAGDLCNYATKETSDLVTLSYSLGELPEESLSNLIKKCWHAADKAVAIIEPGTMPGFARIRKARAEFIALGAHIVAPCPHALACPMAENDWCHFAERLERSSEHRQAKGAILSYEDEKFSYIIVAKTPAQPCQSRVIRHPQKHAGHVCLSLCTLEGLQNSTISRKQGDRYKQARKTEWGDNAEL